MLAASVNAPLWPSLSTGHRLESRIECSSRYGLVRIPTRIRPWELGLQSQPSVGKSRKQSSSIACTATALNATCSASGQTQTVTRCGLVERSKQKSFLAYNILRANDFSTPRTSC
ncbi:uncharacterized protein LOC105786999 isoform X2 [Gossypium raimondii]|uniref:uncharacterized protein LOC105786999 isoform X2 n=1 Tax=Gossypium raimondii TaxID=29730 RepID=UPI00227CEFD1|nr:uncharacterized protein LOC105786999 isoform X2 [Gossypium raimondii]